MSALAGLKLKVKKYLDDFNSNRGAVGFVREGAKEVGRGAWDFGSAVGDSLKSAWNAKSQAKEVDRAVEQSNLTLQAAKRARESGNTQSAINLTRNQGTRLADLSSRIQKEISTRPTEKEMRDKLISGAWRTGLTIAGATSPAKSTIKLIGKKIAIPHLATTMALGSGLNVAFGDKEKSAWERAGEGAGSSVKYAGLNRGTNAIISKLPKIRQEQIANLPTAQKALFNSITNVGEDIAYNKLAEQRGLTGSELAFSAGLPIASQFGGSFIRSINKGKIPEVKVHKVEGRFWVDDAGNFHDPKLNRFVSKAKDIEIAKKNQIEFGDRYFKTSSGEVIDTKAPRIYRLNGKDIPESQVDKYFSDVKSPKMEVVSTKSEKIKLVPKVADQKKIIRDINKGEEALRRGGWGKNRFSPEEMTMVRRGVEDNKIKLKKSVLGTLPENSVEAKAKVQAMNQEYEQAQMEAEQAAALRNIFSSEGIRDVAKIKFLGSKILANGGDIESVRAKYPQLVESVTQAVREAEPTIKTDEEAFRYALELPTKAATLASKPSELKALQNSLESLDKFKEYGLKVQTGAGGRPVAVNAEPTSRSIDKIAQKKKIAEQKEIEQIDRDWQRAVYDQTKADKGLSGRLKTITDSIKQGTASPMATNPEDLKDISNLSSGFRDVYRNFKEAFGQNFDTAKRMFLDPFDRSKGAMIDEQVKLLDDLDNNIVKRLGIEKGSRLSMAVQLFGEGKMSEIELVKEVGPVDAKKVKEADQWFRQRYDQLLVDVNKVRAKIYPNNPEKQIPRRSDYYRHFTELAQGFQGLKNIFDSPANISSTLAGVSDYTRPKTKWLSFAQKRLGDQTEIDAVGGFLDYIKAATYAKHIDPHAANFRNLAYDLGKTVQDMDPEARPNNFVEFLHDFANDLDGKTNPMDRAIQKYIPGGRKAFRVINWLNNRTKANVILGNISSAVAQFFNIPQGIADAGIANSTKGAGRTLTSIFVENSPMKESNFIKTRYASDIYDRFDKGLLANTKKFASWITQVGDEIGTKYIWNSEYEKALSLGVEDAIQYADDATRRMVAGRGIGEVPLVQKSKVFQLVAPFQLEVANLWHVMGEFVGEKNFGKLATLFIAGHLMNGVAKKIRGSDVSFDPISSMMEGFQSYQEEEDKKVGALKFAGRQAGEVLSNVPFGQTLATWYPESGATVGDTKLPARSEFFGEGDPTRFGSGLLIAKGLQDPLYKILPPFGGQQIQRTLEGIKTVMQGYGENKSGKVHTPVAQTPGNFMKAAAFGKYSLPEYQQYFDEKRSPLGDLQSEYFKQFGNDYYNQIIEGREKKSLLDKAKDSIKANAQGAEVMDNIFLILKDNGEVQNIDISKFIGEPPTDPVKKVRWQQDMFSSAMKIYQAESLTDEQKLNAYQKLGVSEGDLAYYDIASDDVNVKRAFIGEYIRSLDPAKDKIEALVALRRTVNGQAILSDNAVTAMVKFGELSEKEGKFLKNIDWDEQKNEPITNKSKGKKISIQNTPLKLTTSGGSLPRMPGVEFKSTPRLKLATDGHSLPRRTIKLKSIASPKLKIQNSYYQGGQKW